MVFGGETLFTHSGYNRGRGDLGRNFLYITEIEVIGGKTITLYVTEVMVIGGETITLYITEVMMIGGETRNRGNVDWKRNT